MLTSQEMMQIEIELTDPQSNQSKSELKQTALRLLRHLRHAQETKANSDVADLIEKLAVANIKLFNVCDKKAELAERAKAGEQGPPWLSKAMEENMRQDIELCKLRSSLKNQINAALGGVQDVKMYGK